MPHGDMIDLHCHLDGSLSVEDVRALSRMTGVEIPKERQDIEDALTFRGQGTLNDYLEKFRLPTALLCSAECMTYAVRSLAERLAAVGCEYAEVRFAPNLHLSGGSTARDILFGAIKGAEAATIPIGLILCCMRGHSRMENERVIELAAEYEGKGVVGVDLAGAEALYPTREYKDIFALASRFGLNITVHAGEAAGADSVRAALDFGAKRLGHAVAAAKDPALLERIRNEGVALEICPTSNVQTGAVKSISRHPVADYLEKGIACVVCSDNMTVSMTDVGREYELLEAAFPTKSALLRASKDAARRYSFEKRA